MRLWSTLSDTTKKKYRAQGVTPQRYNAWEKKSKRSKAQLARLGKTRATFLGVEDPRTKALHHMLRAYQSTERYNPGTVQRNVARMTPAQARSVLHMSADEMRQHARDDAEAQVDSMFFYH